jgi:hypothetical protein
MYANIMALGRQKNKKRGIMVALLICAFFSLTACQQNAIVRGVMSNEGVRRVFPATELAVGQIVRVQLYINMKEGHNHYLVEENIPKEFEIIEGEHNENNEIRIAKVEDAHSAVYTYIVKAPSKTGTYVFNGRFVIDGMKKPFPISGQRK